MALNQAGVTRSNRCTRVGGGFESRPRLSAVGRPRVALSSDPAKALRTQQEPAGTPRCGAERRNWKRSPPAFETLERGCLGSPKRVVVVHPEASDSTGSVELEDRRAGQFKRVLADPAGDEPGNRRFGRIDDHLVELSVVVVNRRPQECFLLALLLTPASRDAIAHPCTSGWDNRSTTWDFCSAVRSKEFSASFNSMSVRSMSARVIGFPIGRSSRVDRRGDPAAYGAAQRARLGRGRRARRWCLDWAESHREAPVRRTSGAQAFATRRSNGCCVAAAINSKSLSTWRSVKPDHSAVAATRMSGSDGARC